MYFGGRKDMEDPEYKSMLTSPKDGTSAPKPSDVRNGDLVSLLLAATPPYLYNMPMVPQTFFFSEMLRSFVQAKAERQNAKHHQVHRRRKRSWREATPPKQEMDKPLELTTQKVPEKSLSPTIKKSAASCDFTAEKLANSSVAPDGGSTPEVPFSVPPMWYPNIYPNQQTYPIDPLHFFIDLRVSAHIWDRKLNEEKAHCSNNESMVDNSPLNLVADFKNNSEKVDFNRCRHHSAFSLPDRQDSPKDDQTFPKSKQSVHYLMNNLKQIYSTPKDEEKPDETKTDVEDEAEKKKKDLRAVIGLELVVDYVKQESDDEDDTNNVAEASNEDFMT